MQFGRGLDRRAAGGCGLGRGQAKLEGGKGVVVAAGGVVLLSDAAANARRTSLRVRRPEKRRASRLTVMELRLC